MQNFMLMTNRNVAFLMPNDENVCNQTCCID